MGEEAIIIESSSLTESLYDRTTGTNIGDLPLNGGLAGSFDGTTNQANSGCSVKASSTTAYVGKTMAAAHPISRVVCHGSNESGYADIGNPTVTLTLYGKNGSAPANGTDGTVLGSISFTDTANESAGRQITSSDTSTFYDHVWVYQSNGGAAGALTFAEIVIYVMT